LFIHSLEDNICLRFSGILRDIRNIKTRYLEPLFIVLAIFHPDLKIRKLLRMCFKYPVNVKEKKKGKAIPVKGCRGP
jgi:hypothetical protein